MVSDGNRMTSPESLLESREWRGVWWLPEDPGTSVSGILTYTPWLGLKLELIGAFEDRIWENVADAMLQSVQRRETFPVIHGTCEGQPMTLMNVSPSGRQQYRTMLDAGYSEQNLDVADAIFGAHVASSSETTFSAFSCSIENLHVFAGAQSTSAEMRIDSATMRPTGEASIAIQTPKPVEVSLPWGTVTLRHLVTMPTQVDAYESRKVETNHSASLEFLPAEPFALDRVWGEIYTAQDLLALALDCGPALSWVSGHVSEQAEGGHVQGGPASRRVWLFRNARGLPDRNRRLSPSGHGAFDATELPLEEVLPRWWEVVERFQAACHMVLGSRYVEDHYLESMVVVAVASAEAFHRQLPDAKPPFSRDDNLRRLSKAFDTLDAETAKWLRSIVPGGFSLAQRLDALAARLPAQTASRLLPNPKAWVKAAKESRNGLMHAGRDEGGCDRLVATLEVTRAVVTVNLLVELGLSDQQLVNALDNAKGLRSASRQAQMHFPTPAQASAAR